MVSLVIQSLQWGKKKNYYFCKSPMGSYLSTIFSLMNVHVCLLKLLGKNSIHCAVIRVQIVCLFIMEKIQPLYTIYELSSLFTFIFLSFKITFSEKIPTSTLIWSCTIINEIRVSSAHLLRRSMHNWANIPQIPYCFFRGGGSYMFQFI